MMTTLEGQMLGRYQLSERIGRGGMADVYRGYQPNLERAVAVKVLHPHLLEDPSFAERFRREAKSVAALHHPNIIQVIDFDTQGDYQIGSRSAATRGGVARLDATAARARTDR